jgi:hypothetical protein
MCQSGQAVPNAAVGGVWRSAEPVGQGFTGCKYMMFGRLAGRPGSPGTHIAQRLTVPGVVVYGEHGQEVERDEAHRVTDE